MVKCFTYYLCFYNNNIIIFDIYSTAAFPAVIVHPFIPSGVTLDSNIVYLPESDDGTSDAIIPSINFPFRNSSRTSIYVS